MTKPLVEKAISSSMKHRREGLRYSEILSGQASEIHRKVFHAVPISLIIWSQLVIKYAAGMA